MKKVVFSSMRNPAKVIVVLVSLFLLAGVVVFWTNRHVGMEGRQGELSQLKPTLPSAQFVPAETQVIKEVDRMPQPSEPSEAAKRLIDLPRKGMAPPFPLLNALREADRPALLAAYHEEPLTNRIALTWALAKLGSEQVFQTFRETLEADYQGREMNIEELGTLSVTMWAIGITAHRLDSAFEYVKERVSPDVWPNIRKWSAHPAFDQPDRRLSGLAVHAIGLSGRPEGHRIIESTAQTFPGDIRDIAGELVDANFYLWFSETYGHDKLFEIMLSLDSTTKELRKWKRTTERGNELDRWYKGVMGIDPSTQQQPR